jgi:predicted GNAT family N-acyltransferase
MIPPVNNIQIVFPISPYSSTIPEIVKEHSRKIPHNISEPYIQNIKAIDTLQIRQSVLWPKKSIHHSILEEDESGLHFGAYLDKQLVSVASVFFDKSIARLRKFATVSEYQSMGIGTKMLHHIIKTIQDREVSFFWCDARTTAISFYENFGMRKEGMPFMKDDIEYIKMSIVF